MGEDAGSDELACLRCDEPLTFLGERDFHEGDRSWGFVLGNFGELFTGGQVLQMYVCEACGHVEFFLPAREE
ncbi:MAG: hypothetical protein M3321_00320 [Actinomycetota bacterium]|nr:hypothetical protein [Actinomycetota bacterium]